MSHADAAVRLQRRYRRPPQLARLLEDSDLVMGQRRYLEDRFDPELWHAALDARRASMLHTMLKLVVVLGGVAITALVAADMASGVISAVIGLAIAGAGALDDYFKLGTAAERAKKLRRTLEREAWSYVNLGDFYAGSKSHTDMFDDFRRRVETMLDPDSADMVALQRAS